MQYIHKIFSVGMALLVLLSTFSFTVKKRYCSDNLIDVVIFSEFEDCCKSLAEDTVAKISKKRCCKDEAKIIQGQQVFKNSSFDDLEYVQQQLLTAFVYAYINYFEGLPQHIVPFKEYSPPNLVVDRQVLDQVFLI